MKKLAKPQNKYFSSGPCAKFSTWNTNILSNALIGRSHRSKEGKTILKSVIQNTKRVLQIPDDYILAIVPGSDTGAIEIALWNLLGPKGVDVLAWDSFGLDWVNDVVNQLRLSDVNVLESDYGGIPNLKNVSSKRDVVFTWNGTTSGVCIPNVNWIDKKREGLTICDATSAVFAMDIDWDCVDATTFSWQKALGGEAAHGMIVLSPRAVKRINSFTPSWPIPKLFNLKKNGKLNQEIFEGLTINTPSMLAIQDWTAALKWVDENGGLKVLQNKSVENFGIIKEFCRKNEWIDFLATEESTRSITSVCLKFIDSWFISLNEHDQRKKIKYFCKALEIEGVAFDIEGYRSAPPGIRIWCGPTIEPLDLRLLMPWLFWAWNETLKQK